MQDEVRFGPQHQEVVDLLLEMAMTPKPEMDNTWCLTDLTDRMALDEHEAGLLLEFMHRVGIITDVGDRHGLPYTFKISQFAARQTKDKLEREKAAISNTPPPNIVEQFSDWVKRRPWTAWPIIGFTTFVAIATAANQVLSIVKTIWFWGKP